MKGILYTDGGARGNPGAAGSAAILYDGQSELVDVDGTFSPFLTNNQAEYIAFILGLKLALANGITEIECKMDSELIVKQINGEYKVRDSNMQQYKNQVISILAEFKSYSITHVSREFNRIADKLVNLIIDTGSRKK